MDTENKPNQKQQSPFGYSTGSFVEYFSASPGQHMITVRTTVNGKKRIIGKVFKKYDQELKKYKYTAIDREGNAIFEPTINLYELKKQFIDNEKSLAPTLPSSQEKEKLDVAKDAEPRLEKANREDELEQVRKGKEEKSQQIER